MSKAPSGGGADRPLHLAVGYSGRDVLRVIYLLVNFLIVTGSMENIQINGQRIWGPPKDWVGQPPPHGTEVFIKNIPDDVFEDELYHLFSQVGRVYEVRLPVHWTGVNKGYAFVRFTKIPEADAAMVRLNSFTIRQGRKIKVERSLDNTRLFLSSVPIHMTGEEIKNELLTVVENVKTVYVYPALKNPSVFRGYAFVEFVCHRDAAIAKRILNPDVLFTLFEKKCVAAWATPLPFLNNETLRNINILFMRNIPNNIKTVSIRIVVDTLISPDNVSKVKRVNDYAFLTFKNHDIADRALTKIKCNPFLLGMNAVQVEWAIPKEFAKSFFSKNTDMEDNSELESDFDSKTENYHSGLKLLEDYKNFYPDVLKTDYINMNCIAHDNASFESPKNPSPIRILQRRDPEFGSLLSLNKTETNIKKPKINGNFFNEWDKYPGKRPSEFSAFLPVNHSGQKDIFRSRACNNDENIITEFQNQNSEFGCRDMHLKTWLQSLSLSNQFTPCNMSPSLTSPSTSSSTNLSCKWDENCSQFSTGSGVSMGYGLKTRKSTETALRYQQFATY